MEPEIESLSDLVCSTGARRRRDSSRPEELNEFAAPVPQTDSDQHIDSRRQRDSRQQGAGTRGALSLRPATLDSFIQPAKLQVLVVPVVPIRRRVFDRHVETLNRYSIVPLADVPPDRRGDRAVFSASPNASGSLLLDFVTPSAYAASRPLAFLADLQTHRRVQGIIGILDASEYTTRSLEEALANFQSTLKGLPKTFATKVFGFGANEDQLEQARNVKESDGLVMVPSEGDVSFFLKTILAEFASGILWEFSNMAAQLESRTSIPTPQEHDSLSLQRAVSRASIESGRSYHIPDRGTSPIHQSPITNGTSVMTPPQSHPHTLPNGISTAPKRDSLAFGTNSLSSSPKPILPSTSAASGVATTAQLVDARARRRVAGREKKLMGDMWLLSGRPQEAIIAYNEAILLTKAWADQVWQASAYEGVAVALVLQATQPRGSQGTQPPSLGQQRSDSPSPSATIPHSSTFLSAIPERLTLAVTLYEKMLAPINPSRESAGSLDPDRAHPLLYVEACLRNAKFLLAVHEAQGSMPKALQHLVAPRQAEEKPEMSSAEQARQARLNSLVPSNTVPRSSIATWLNSAYSPQLQSLEPPTRIRILSEIAALFARVGYRRKEAFVLREVAALCAEAAAQHDIGVEGFESPRGKPFSPKMPVINEVNGTVREGQQRARVDSAALIRILDKICAAAGLDTPPETAATAGHDAPLFGWPAVQLGILKDAALIAEAVQDHPSAIGFIVRALRSLAASIPPFEQYDLSASIPRITAAANLTGTALELDYWGPTELVMSLEVAPLASSRQPFEVDQGVVGADRSGELPATKQNPFLYDPRQQSKASIGSQALLVQGEAAEIYVTLQNPFLFELDIKNISLSTEGAAFASESTTVSIPPNSLQMVRLSGTPLEPGQLRLRGCHVQLAGCMTREFTVAREAVGDPATKCFPINILSERIKRTGLDAVEVRASNPTPSDGSEAGTGTSFVECVVVPEQPLLWTRSTSLTHGALMLYDGEISTIRIALENASSTPVDFLRVSYSDSLTDATRAYLADAELDAAEVYDLEADVVDRPVFKWTGDVETHIAAGQSHLLEVECRGKIGCMSGSIQIEYGSRESSLGGRAGKIWTRRLTCDVLLTVHQTLVAHSLSISHLKSGEGALRTHARSASVVSLGQRGAAVDSRLEDSLRGVEDGEHCLVSLDVTNVCGKPFEVKLERQEEENDFYLERKRAEPGSTHRLLVRVDRHSFSHEELARSIPSLSERQFIAARVKRSADEERVDRELFWYREELLRRIRLSWNEVGSLRTGSIGVQGLRLDPAMLEVLRQDDVRIELSLAGESAERTGDRPHSAYSAAADDFLEVEATVTSSSAAALPLRLRLELLPPNAAAAAAAASLSHLARYVVIEGVTPINLDLLQPGHSTSATIPLCLLAQGRYDFGCVVEERTEGLRTPRSWRSRSTLTILVNS